MKRRMPGLPTILLFVVAIVGLGWLTQAVNAESGRLTGQYRGPTDETGCACNKGGAPASLWLLGLIGLVAIRRRR